MTHSFLPALPTGYHWQLCGEDGAEITGDYYAECDATEARIWAESGDAPEIVLTRTGSWGYWGPDGPSHEGGLRQWAIETPVEMIPEGLYSGEEFTALADVGRRIKLAEIEEAF
jgi:hypothetical protein